MNQGFKDIIYHYRPYGKQSKPTATVLVRMFKYDGHAVNISVAKCHKADDYNKKLGAQLALERMDEYLFYKVPITKLTKCMYANPLMESVFKELSTNSYDFNEDYYFPVLIEREYEYYKNLWKKEVCTLEL